MLIFGSPLKVCCGTCSPSQDGVLLPGCFSPLAAGGQIQWVLNMVVKSLLHHVEVCKDSTLYACRLSFEHI